jgi:hypothetical protein
MLKSLKSCVLVVHATYLFPEELTNNESEGRQSMIGMLKTFILSNVVPNIRKRLSMLQH